MKGDGMTDEQRQARLRHHMYETCEGIAEHAERIVALEELVADYIRDCGCDGEYCDQYVDGSCKLLERAMGLGVLG